MPEYVRAVMRAETVALLIGSDRAVDRALSLTASGADTMTCRLAWDHARALRDEAQRTAFLAGAR